jgi:hypothetical protein
MNATEQKKRARLSAQRIIQIIAVTPDVDDAEERIAVALQALVKETIGYCGLTMVHVLADALQTQAQLCTCGAKLEPNGIVKTVTDALTGVVCVPSSTDALSVVG